jgi:hypothetical protein
LVGVAKKVAVKLKGECMLRTVGLLRKVGAKMMPK